MEKIAPILILVSNKKRSFTAVLRLYSIWGERLESESLEKQKKAIESKLSSKKQVHVNVVGTDT